MTGAYVESRRRQAGDLEPATTRGHRGRSSTVAEPKSGGVCLRGEPIAAAHIAGGKGRVRAEMVLGTNPIEFGTQLLLWEGITGEQATGGAIQTKPVPRARTQAAAGPPLPALRAEEAIVQRASRTVLTRRAAANKVCVSSEAEIRDSAYQ